MPGDSDPASLIPGDSFDRYVVEGLLGRGGMGEVWQAIDPKLDRRIALKILASADPRDPRWAEASARMIREARAVAALSHPNVISVFDVGKVGERPYIAMELVEGATLRTFVGDARVSMRRRVQWLVEIARALASAHRRGIIHRDVKPENVMVRTDGTLKVLDFGIARRAHVDPTDGQSLSITRDGELVGTLLYMAPEQLSGTPIDARTDQFAWGIVALELLRGEHPWASRTGPPAVVSAIVNDEPPPLEAMADVTPALATAIARATSKHPEDRFTTMDALLTAIDAAEPMPSLHMTAVPMTSPMSTTSEPVVGDERSPLAHTLEGVQTAGDPPKMSPQASTLPPLPAQSAEEPAALPMRRRPWWAAAIAAAAIAAVIGVTMRRAPHGSTDAPSASQAASQAAYRAPEKPAIAPIASAPLTTAVVVETPAITPPSAPPVASIATARVRHASASPAQKKAAPAAPTASASASRPAPRQRESGENDAPIFDPD